MPENKKISDLVDDTGVSLSDYIPIVTTGVSQTRKATLARVLALAEGSGGSGISEAVFLDGFEVDLATNDTGIPNGTQVNAGDSISSFLQAAFRKATPASYMAPKASLSGNAAPGVFEVGQSVSVAFTIGFTQNDGGAEFTADRVLNKNGSQLTPVSGSYSDNIVVSTSPINYQAVLHYAQGPVKNDSLGSPSPAGQIADGHASSNVLTYEGTYRIFFGAPDMVINAGNLRSLLGNVWLTGAVIDFPTGSTYRNFYIAVPPGYTLQTFVDFTSSSASLMGSVSNAAVTIADAGMGTLNYTLYQLTTGAPYSGSGDLFKFNIGQL